MTQPVTWSITDPFRFTTIAHAAHRYCSPLSEGKAETLISIVAHSAAMSKDAPILDVGCGKASFLLQAVARLGASGVGIDPNPTFIDQAAKAARDAGLADRVEFHRSTVADVALGKHQFSAVFCIGATHAYGGYRAGLNSLAELVRPGGVLLVGEGYWRKSPDPSYLAFLGAQPDDYMTHGENEAIGLTARLQPLYSCTSSTDEWDHYEGLYLASMERHLASHPEDPDTEAFANRMRQWRDAYRRYGRDTLGFGFYLFRAPA